MSLENDRSGLLDWDWVEWSCTEPLKGSRGSVRSPDVLTFAHSVAMCYVKYEYTGMRVAEIGRNCEWGFHRYLIFQIWVLPLQKLQISCDCIAHCTTRKSHRLDFLSKYTHSTDGQCSSRDFSFRAEVMKCYRIYRNEPPTEGYNRIIIFFLYRNDSMIKFTL